MSDERTESTALNNEELRTALLHVIGAINEVDAGLREIMKGLHLASTSRGLPGPGPGPMPFIASPALERLERVQGRLRNALDILVKEDKNDG